MKQSHLLSPACPGLHVAIIMDGSGRWAVQRGLARSSGHRFGVEAVRRAVEAASRLGIGTLTLFAFSSDNWQRPGGEVSTLMKIFEAYLRADVPVWVECDVRLTVIGRRDGLPLALASAIEAAEKATHSGRKLHLRLAINYSGREAILEAARRARKVAGATSDDFTRLLGQVTRGGEQRSPDVDLLIRTGGEQRLSDFMLWECAYSELIFSPQLWPDFRARDLEAAVKEFHARDRRFGRIVHEAAS